MSITDIALAPGDAFLHINDAVRRSGRCRSTIYDAIGAGDLTAYKHGSRTVIRERDFLNWMTANLQPFNSQTVGA